MACHLRPVAANGCSSRFRAQSVMNGLLAAAPARHLILADRSPLVLQPREDVRVGTRKHVTWPANERQAIVEGGSGP